MTRIQTPFISLIFFLVLAIRMADSTDLRADQKKEMEQLRAILSELLPDLFSDARFNSPKNFKRIESNVKKLAALAHDIPGNLSDSETQTEQDRDVSIALISGLFRQDALLALTHFRAGHTIYARNVLKAIPNFCIACHSRSAGLDLSDLQKELPKTLTSMEAAEFLNATRQFDRALDEFEKILTTPLPAHPRRLEWERAARHAIDTAVRVKRDPVRALKFVDLILSSSSSPSFFQEDAQYWKTQLQQWQKEEVKQLPTADAVLEEAKRLMGQAKTIQEYPADRAADILYLRGTSVLHDFLRRFPDDGRVSEVLLMLGICYETLQDMQIWSLHDLYYEACIRQSPHSTFAQACYVRYEQSMFFGYSGSGGTFLPEEVRKHLQELEELAALQESF